MKVRQGRKNLHNLYLQVGDEPSDGDISLGYFANPTVAAVVADAVNRSGMARLTVAPFSGPERVLNAVRISE